MALQSSTLRPGLLVSLKTSITGNVNYDSHNHEQMVHIRAKKVENIADAIPELKVQGDESGDQHRRRHRAHLRRLVGDHAAERRLVAGRRRRVGGIRPVGTGHLDGRQAIRARDGATGPVFRGGGSHPTRGASEADHEEPRQ